MFAVCLCRLQVFRCQAVNGIYHQDGTLNGCIRLKKSPSPRWCGPGGLSVMLIGPRWWNTLVKVHRWPEVDGLQVGKKETSWNKGVFRCHFSHGVSDCCCGGIQMDVPWAKPLRNQMRPAQRTRSLFVVLGSFARRRDRLFKSVQRFWHLNSCMSLCQPGDEVGGKLWNIRHSCWVCRMLLGYLGNIFVSLLGKVA